MGITLENLTEMLYHGVYGWRTAKPFGSFIHGANYLVRAVCACMHMCVCPSLGPCENAWE